MYDTYARRGGRKDRQLGIVGLVPLAFFFFFFFFSIAGSSSSFKFPYMASTSLSRWVRPEVFPLVVTVGVAVGICGMQLVRNITTNPEVRVTKKNRAAGVLDNFEEGERYKEHRFRRLLRNRNTEIMPSINNFFSNPN